MTEPEPQNGVAVANDHWPASSRVHIADLQKERDVLPDENENANANANVSPSLSWSRYIEASVSLVWPYSSSTRTFSLLVAELDLATRARIAQRQVKVTFYNGAAKAAQDSRVGIGDTIRLSLDGCRWETARGEVSTPGKRLSFDIVFTRSLKLVVNPGHVSERKVNYQRQASPFSPAELSPTVHSVVNLSDSIIPGSTIEIPIPFSSPAPRKSLRLSSNSFVEASLDPFAEDKDYVYGRSRKRTKFARHSASWRLLDDSGSDNGDADGDADDNGEVETTEPDAVEFPVPSQSASLQPIGTAPQSADVSEDTTVTEQPSLPQTSSVANRAEDLMPPPQWRPQALPQEERHIILPENTENTAEEVVTPRLHHLPSPGLRLVSPLVTGFGGPESGFFSPSDVRTVSALDGAAPASASASPSADTANSGNYESVERTGLDGPFQVETATQAVEYSPTTEDPPTTATLPESFNDLEVEELPVTPPRLPELPRPVTPSPKPATDVLAVLERFLEMSPTASEPLQVPQPSKPPVYPTEDLEGSEEGDRASASASLAALPSTSDAFYSNHRLTLAAEPMISQEIVESVMINEPQSSAASVGGSESLLEHQSGPTSRVIVNDEETMDEITAVDKYPHEGHYLPTPAQTQEQEQEQEQHQDQEENQEQQQERKVASIRSLIQTPLPVAPSHSYLPTPSHSQVKIQTPSHNLDGIADSAQQAQFTGSVEKMASISRRRLTQEGTSHLSSPYFSSRKHPSPDEDVRSPTSPSSKMQQQQQQHSRGERGSSAHSSGLTTSVAYYAPLASLHEYYNQLLDVIAICVSNSTAPKQATKGLKDWHTTLHIADPSFVDDDNNSNKTTRPPVSAQIFRYSETAVPVAKRGDAIILRDFKVITHKHEACLISTESSSWAVFDGSLDEQSMIEEPAVTISGPPLEYGRGETAYVRKMARWWADQAHNLFPTPRKHDSSVGTRTQIQSQAQTQTQIQEEAAVQSIEESPKSPVRTRRRAQLAEEVQAHGQAKAQGQVQGQVHGEPQTGGGSSSNRKQPSATPTPRRSRRVSNNLLSLPSSSSSSSPRQQQQPSSPPDPPPPPRQGQRPRRSTRSTKSPSLVHELRDGKEYVDGGGGGGGSSGSPRNKRSSADSVNVHELRNGTMYRDEE